MDQRQSQIKKELLAFQTLETLEGKDLWKYLYPTQTITSRVKGINEVIFLRQIIREIREEFNQIFQTHKKQKIKTLDKIEDNNQKIAELQQELNQETLIFTYRKELIQDIKRVFILAKEEVTFEKFISERQKKDEQVALENEEKRLKEILRDDTNLRALKQMMNNTIEEQKQKMIGQIDEMEDWMSKPKDQMSEEEKQKLIEFLDRQEIQK